MAPEVYSEVEATISDPDILCGSESPKNMQLLFG
jgi:hypothetical protein